MIATPLDLALPIHRYAEAFPPRSGTFVLDGGGFAMMGAEPFATFRASRDEGPAAFARLRALLAPHAQPRSEDCPLPFQGGAVGYVGYEMGQALERLPRVPRPGVGMPDMAFGLHDWVLGQHRAGGRAWLVARDPARRDAVLRVIEAFTGRASRDHEHAQGDIARLMRAAGVRRSVPREAYIARILEAKEHIARGDAYEICLTHALSAEYPGDPQALFRALVHANPAPYAALLDLPEGAVVSSSPERFLKLDAQRVAESRPIKGTRRRGSTREEDARLAAELAASEKDRAENVMIVDLVRHDLGKVAKIGSVKVPELFAVEAHPTLHQLVSTVRAELAEGRDAVDLLAACFPPGSMTGAPKNQAMAILEHLEPQERGVYAGGLGYIGFDGTMDASVVIRALVVKDGTATFSVGGAIVESSDPEAEHEETMHKAYALVAALARCKDPPSAAFTLGDHA